MSVDRSRISDALVGVLTKALLSRRSHALVRAENCLATLVRVSSALQRPHLARCTIGLMGQLTDSNLKLGVRPGNLAGHCVEDVSCSAASWLSGTRPYRENFTGSRSSSDGIVAKLWRLDALHHRNTVSQAPGIRHGLGRFWASALCPRYKAVPTPTHRRIRESRQSCTLRLAFDAREAAISDTCFLTPCV